MGNCNFKAEQEKDNIQGKVGRRFGRLVARGFSLGENFGPEANSDKFVTASLPLLLLKKII